MRETTLSLPEVALVAGTLTTIPLALLVLGKSRKVQNSSLPDGILPDG